MSCFVYICTAVSHVDDSILREVWMTQVWGSVDISRGRFPECPWRETWQRKTIRQASKDRQRLPASPPSHHLPTPPTWTPSPLRVCKNASIWMDCQWQRGASPQTATAMGLLFSDFPHQILLQASSLAVCHLCPVENQVGALLFYIIFPKFLIWSEYTPNVAMGRPAAPSSHPGEVRTLAVVARCAEFTWSYH